MSAKATGDEAAKTTARVLEPSITVEDIKRKAEQVRDIARSDVKRIAEDDITRTLIIAAVAVGVAVSVAYYLGTRRH